jgi:predicted nucleotide-binding protein
MTAEDETVDGELRARQNVVHELGLFQGKLGFSRAIALLEEGADDFSNLHGIQQIRFSRDNIKETFGDVLAVLRREFPIL